MKIQCPCGFLIHDGSDDLPHKAHLIPDQGWNALFDALDDLIGRRCDTPARREGALMEVRLLIGRAGRRVWQCRECGRLHVDGPDRATHCYAPEDGAASRELLRAGPSHAA